MQAEDQKILFPFIDLPDENQSQQLQPMHSFQMKWGMSKGGLAQGHCSCWPLPVPPVTRLNFVVHLLTWIPMPLLSSQGQNGYL